MIFLDTNIFLRYFLQEDEQATKRIERLFADIVEGHINAVSNSLVIAEIVWVLQKAYCWDKEKICENIELILNTPHIRFFDRNVLLASVQIFKNTEIDYIDAYTSAFMRVHQIETLYSYDKHFDLFHDLKRRLP